MRIRYSRESTGDGLKKKVITLKSMQKMPLLVMVGIYPKFTSSTLVKFTNVGKDYCEYIFLLYL